MCTLIAIHRAIPAVPLVIAANRDEYLDRPSEGPALRELASLGTTQFGSAGSARQAGFAIAPRDLRAGGTWLGRNEAGVFVAVTNRPCERDDTRLSRGGMVTDALMSRSAEEAAKRLSQLSARAYNPFNCFVADRDRAFALVYEEGPSLMELAPGAHVIGNADPDDRSHPKVSGVLERAEAIVAAASWERGGVDALLGPLAEICRDHESGAGDVGDVCVHFGGYGTRSSMLMVQAEDAADERLLWAEGAPCETEYQDVSSLLHELSAKASYGAAEERARKAS